MMKRFTRSVILVAFGVLPMITTGCEILDVLGNQVVDALDRNDDSIGSQLDAIIDSLGIDDK